MKRILALGIATALGLTMLFQFGCAGRSQSANFYVLSPVAHSGQAMQTGSNSSNKISIGISQVSLPKYLKRSQIVTRTGSNELHLAEYERWAGKLEEDIGRVLAENLAYMLGTEKVLSYPATKEIPIDYSVNIAISRFDGRLGGDIELVARWSVLDSQGQTLFGVKASRIVEQTKGRGYADMVAAQSRALLVFSHEIAEALKELAAS